MTVELITGYSGTPHIGSDDVQHLLAGIVGGGSYALDTGKKLAIAVNSANSVTIDTGDAIIAGGAHVRVAAAEKLTVTSGAQGVKRNDLVCLRYTKASDNKESAALVVVKGTATSGTPADPAVNTGSIIDGKATVDMPLYRLPLDGVSLGTPVKLFNVSPTLASLGDSVSQLGGLGIKGARVYSISDNTNSNGVIGKSWDVPDGCSGRPAACFVTEGPAISNGYNKYFHPEVWSIDETQVQLRWYDHRNNGGWVGNQYVQCYVLMLWV